MRRYALSALAAMGIAAPLWAASSDEPALHDFAYRAQVVGQGQSALLRVSVPFSVYQKVVYADLRDIRVFNSAGEGVPYALEQPAAGAPVKGAAKALPMFPLKDESPAALDALRVTIESGKTAINLRSDATGALSANTAPASGSVHAYILDARELDNAIAALELRWREDAVDFAGRVKVEASDTLGDWRVIRGEAPIANLRSNGEKLQERRVEIAHTRAKFWRLSWLGPAPPFYLTSVLAEPPQQNADPQREMARLKAVPATQDARAYEFDLSAQPPVDRVDVSLAELNTIAELQIESKSRAADPWRPVVRSGFYRLRSGDQELTNGPVEVGVNSDRYWRVRADGRGGGVGRTAPSLVLRWVPHDIVFLARGTPPFYLAYGNAVASSAAVSFAELPKNVAINRASLAAPEASGGEERLKPPPAPYPWKKAILWLLLIASAALLGWMALRLARES